MSYEARYMISLREDVSVKAGAIDTRIKALDASIKRFETSVKEATTRLSTSIDSLGEKIEGLEGKLGEAREAGARMSSSAQQWIGAMRDLSSVVVSASITMFVWNLIQRRIEYAQYRLTEATERYEEVVAKYGAYSRQAERAMRRVEMAQRDLSRATFEARIQAFLYTLQLVPLGTRLVEVARHLGALTGVTSFQMLLDKIHNVILTKKVILYSMLTFGISAIVGITAWMIARQQMYNESIAETSEKLDELQGRFERFRPPEPRELEYEFEVRPRPIEHRIQIEPPRFSVESLVDLDRAIDDMGSKLKSEIRRVII